MMCAWSAGPVDGKAATVSENRTVCAAMIREVNFVNNHGQWSNSGVECIDMRFIACEKVCACQGGRSKAGLIMELREQAHERFNDGCGKWQTACHLTIIAGRVLCLHASVLPLLRLFDQAFSVRGCLSLHLRCSASTLFSRGVDVTRLHD